MTLLFGKNPDWNKVTTWLLVILLCILIWTIPACSAYHKIRTNGGKPPETTQDSTNLSGRCVATFPQKQPQFIAGKTITTVVVKKDTLNTTKFINKVDTIFKNTTNIDSLKRAILNEAANDCNPFEDDTTNNTHDTLKVYPDSAMVYNLKSNSALKDTQIESLTTSSNIYQSEKDKYLLWFILACIGAAATSAWAIKKTFT